MIRVGVLSVNIFAVLFFCQVGSFVKVNVHPNNNVNLNINVNVRPNDNVKLNINVKVRPNLDVWTNKRLSTFDNENTSIYHSLTSLKGCKAMVCSKLEKECLEEY